MVVAIVTKLSGQIAVILGSC